MRSSRPRTCSSGTCCRPAPRWSVAIAFVTTVSVPMAAALAVVGGIVVVAMFRLAAAGKPLHHEFADKSRDRSTARWSTSSATCRWCGHFAASAASTAASTRTIDREMTARQRSLLYLERLRILHALVTVVLTIGLLAWAIALWQRGSDHHRRRRAGLHARTFRAACDARSRGRAGRRDPASGAARRSARDAAGAA